MSRTLVGRNETITLAEAEEMEKEQLNSMYGYLIGMVDELTDDEEERATAKANLSSALAKLLSAEMLRVSLMDDEEVLLALFGSKFAETVKFEDAG